MEYGIQMYSVRDITEKNMDGALKALAEMGYKFVEFAGFFGIPADEIKAMLDKYGLNAEALPSPCARYSRKGASFQCAKGLSGCLVRRA